MRYFWSTIAIVLFATTASADMIVRKSAHDVPTTIDRLAAAVKKAGARVFARIDHAAGARNIGAKLRPTTMLMFGNPKLGTPALQAAQTIGIDLPLRVVAYRDKAGQVWIAYHDPADLAAAHGLAADLPVIGKMRGALKNLTSAAARK